MKKLLLLLIAAMSIVLSGCEVKKETSASVEFTVASDCGTKENLTKIENLLKSKGLPIGATKITAEGETIEAVKEQAQKILESYLLTISDEDIKALNTGATFVNYEAAFPGLAPFIIAKRNL